MKIKFLLRCLTTGGAALLLVVGCQKVGAAPAGAPPVVEVDTTDYAFAAPGTLPSGLVTLRLVNRGQEPHHAQLFRLNDGVSFEAFAAAVHDGPQRAITLASAMGGPGTIDPNGAEDVTAELAPGTYALVCFVPGPDGVPHVAHGMLQPLQVTAERTDAQAPDVAATLRLRDFSFDMPETLAGGRATYAVQNLGLQPHEVALVKLGPNATLDDVRAFFERPAGPPPFKMVGGVNALDPGRTAYLSLDLQSGCYAAVCLVPDPEHGQTHLELGMLKAFTVVG
jgi:hypothetical protein